MNTTGPTEEDSIEEILVKASSKVEANFKDAKFDYEEAQTLMNSRNEQRAKAGRTLLTLDTLLENAFKPLKKKNAMDYNYRFALAFYALEDYEKAKEYLLEARNQPLRAQLTKVMALAIRTHVKLAEQTGKQKYLAKAKKICDSVIKDSKRGSLIEWTIGELSDIHRLQAKYNQAMRLLKKHVTKYSSLYLNIAEIYAQLTKKEEMFVALQTFLDRNPGRWNFVDDNKFFKPYKDFHTYKELRFIYKSQQESSGGSSCFSRWNTRGIFARLKEVAPVRARKSS